MRYATVLLFICSGAAWAQADRAGTLIEGSDPFSSGGVVMTVAMNMIVTVELHKVEKGALNGVEYRFYYTDGSGTFSGTPGNHADPSEEPDSNWSVACKKDPDTQRKMCSMYMNDLWFFVYGDGTQEVRVGEEHMPNSSIALRLDEGQPYTASSRDGGAFSRQTEAEILAQLKHAKSLTTKYYRRPDQTPVDHTWNLYGFNETLQYIHWAVQRIR